MRESLIMVGIFVYIFILFVVLCVLQPVVIRHKADSHKICLMYALIFSLVLTGSLYLAKYWLGFHFRNYMEGFSGSESILSEEVGGNWMNPLTMSVDSPAPGHSSVAKLPAPTPGNNSVAKLPAPTPGNNSVAKPPAPTPGNNSVAKPPAPTPGNNSVAKLPAPAPVYSPVAKPTTTSAATKITPAQSEILKSLRNKPLKKISKPPTNIPIYSIYPNLTEFNVIVPNLNVDVLNVAIKGIEMKAEINKDIMFYITKCQFWTSPGWDDFRYHITISSTNYDSYLLIVSKQKTPLDPPQYKLLSTSKIGDKVNVNKKELLHSYKKNRDDLLYYITESIYNYNDKLEFFIYSVDFDNNIALIYLKDNGGNYYEATMNIKDDYNIKTVEISNGILPNGNSIINNERTIWNSFYSK
jgi:hypothetical protein